MMDSYCPFCPGMHDNELHLFCVCKKYEKIRPNMMKNIEQHHEHSQFVQMLSCYLFKKNKKSKHVTNYLNQKLLKEVRMV